MLAMARAQKRFYVLLFLPLLSACGQKASFNSTRSAAVSEDAAVHQGLSLPEGIKEPQSPFAKTKIFLPPKSLELADSGEWPVNIIYKDESPCHELIPKLSGGQEPVDLQDNEFSVGATPAKDFDFKSLAANDCIIGISYNPTVKVPTPKAGNSAGGLNLTGGSPDEIIGFDSEAQKFFADIDSNAVKTKVAVIDSGLDLKNQKISGSVTKDLRVTSYYSYIDSANKKQMIIGDDPTDELGHGTAVTSVIADDDFGLAAGHVEIIPIKVTKNGSLSSGELVGGIARAVNKGADVISMSLGGDVLGCDPAVGYAMLKAREKGAVFVTAAGNGMKGVGYPIVAARDDGPATYEQTFSPACWSRYFLGALSVAATDAGSSHLAQFSNYGDDLEMSAPGVNIKVASLKNQITTMSGTSLATPIITSAVALAIAHHRAKGLSFAPWYIENLLVQSANRDVDQGNENRRVRFGSIVNFHNLATLLKKTESMTDEQRRNDIQTINPRNGDGWDPGNDVANIRLIRISFLKDSVAPGETIEYKVTAFYRVGAEKDVTASSDTIVSLSDASKMTLEKPGVIRVKDASVFKFKEPEDYASLSITVNYAEKQAQVFTTGSFYVSMYGLSLTNLKLKAPNTPVRVGQAVNPFHVTGIDPKGQEVDITGSSKWTTSAPDEIKFIDNTGILDASNAISGKSYTIYAETKWEKVSYDFIAADESVTSFQIHSYLGEGSEIEAGQKLVVEPHFILTQKREAVLPGVWTLDGKPVNGGVKSTAYTLDTAGMVPGTYTIGVTSIFRHISGDKTYTDTYEFKIGEAIDHLEIHLKTTIVSTGQDFQVDLRAYRLNNSYVVVTDSAVWTSDHPDFIQINAQGIGHIDAKMSPGTVKLTANYKTHQTTMNLAVVDGSSVTGSSSELDHVELKVTPMGYCLRPLAQVQAVYKDGSKRSQIAETLSYSWLNDQGQWVDATLPYYGGRHYRVSATYNDGNTNANGGGDSVVSTEYDMPKAALDKLTFAGDGGRSLEGAPIVAKIGAVSKEQPRTKENICAMKSATTSGNGVTLRLVGKDIDYIPVAEGQYTITGTANYTGNGVDQILTGSFQIDVIPTKIVALKITRNMASINGKRPYGIQGFLVDLLDETNATLRYVPSDMNYQFFENGVEVDSSKRDRLFVSGQNQLGFEVAVYPKTMSANYKVRVTHKATGLSAEYAFTLVGAWESKEAGSPGLPSTEPPAINTTIDAACLTPYTGSFMPGAGTAASPYVICVEADFAKMKQHNGKYLLGKNFDFAGRSIQPTSIGGQLISLDGGGRSLANYVIIDSERDEVAFFDRAPRSISNLIVVNPTVRGRDKVGALNGFAGMDYSSNVHIIGGTVWGRSSVGGISGSTYGAGDATSFRHVGVYGTEVRFEGSTAGGLFGYFASVAPRVDASGKIVDSTISSYAVFTGTVAPAGVPGTSINIGGIAGSISSCILKNSLVTGSVAALNGTLLETNVGGIIGYAAADSEIMDSEFRGLVVSTGTSVGGIVGSISGTKPFGLDHADAYSFGQGVVLSMLSYDHRGGLLLRNKVTGSVWGGMSRKKLECLNDDGLNIVLGVGGSTSCIGDIKEQTGGFSNVGGVAGTAKNAVLQDNVFLGKARAINSVGGIVGRAYISNFIRNQVSGLVSASDGVKEYGSLVGTVDTSFGKIPSRFDSNVINAGPGVPTWTIGNNGGVLQETFVTNVPGEYPKQ